MKTLIVVHPGSLFGSAEFTAGKSKARAYRSQIMDEISNHQGNLIVIDGFLSDEIHEDFEDAIELGLSNAISNAARAGTLNSCSALRLWGCDAGESPFDEWRGFGSCTQPQVFKGQEEAAEFLTDRLVADEIVVTGAWATLHGRWGCVNSVADVFRSKRPGTSVRISEHALYEGDESI